MVELANKFPNEKDKIKKAALNQCARELVLAQSSDWLFIITNGTGLCQKTYKRPYW